ncbi:zinc-ribbon and DUF3426 domain-containing protein [Methylocaldum gracile]|uniref:zinc-ribbon and DUF3426 domain-containing protein n=2 Tax=unclassified Methylocaldum TaxID=2622260 RepID=UPI0010607D24
MFTRCPECKTAYRISVGQLRAGRGEALCDRCHIVFNVLVSLGQAVKDAVPEDTPQARPPVLGDREAVLLRKFERELSEESGGEQSGTEHKSKAFDGEARAGHGKGKSGPSSVTPGAFWGLGVFGLLGLLIAQLVIFEGDRIVQSARLRPWLDMACKTIDCSLPPYKDVRRIQIFDRALRPDSTRDDALEFQLVFANQSNLPQMLPNLKLVLTELNGSPVAERIFTPAEYLPEGEKTSLMPVGKPFEIRLLLAKPTNDVGGFTFELL